MLEKKEALMGKKIAEELARAREANRQGNKRRAIHHLKKKKMYEAQLDALATSQLKLQEQVIMLEGSKATSETYGALRSGADAMRRMAKETKIEDVDATMDVINEQTDQMRQVQEALGQPVGFAAELDEDELEEELKELDALEVEDSLLDRELAKELEEEPAMPSVPLPSVPVAPAAVSSTPEDEEAELKALQAEMELL
jgi:charged multivesicular body protein 4|tara:strand:- start:245 stop:841 length:597 start_codon:yes stop_codon:yes gene_type:complete